MRRIRTTNDPSPNGCRRCGTVIVEFAIVVSVFAVFMAGIIEFGHAYLVIGSINAATRGAARIGAVEGTTTQQVRDEATRILGAAFNGTTAVIRVKDASTFDSPGVDPENIDYAALPDIEVSSLEMGQLFIVQIEVLYEDVALMPPFWAQGVMLRSQSVTRHE